MKEKLARLISVKSIVTIVLTAVFAYLAIVGVVSGQEFLTVFTVVIAFYYGTQAQKNADSVAEAPVEEHVNAIGFETGEE